MALLAPGSVGDSVLENEELVAWRYGSGGKTCSKQA